MRILFVASSNSIHTARWISQISHLGWDLHLFPSHEYAPVHPQLENIKVHYSFYNKKLSRDPSVRVKGFPMPGNFTLSIAQALQSRFRPNQAVERLLKVIRKLRPDIVHSMEFQAAGYLSLKVREILDNSFHSKNSCEREVEAGCWKALASQALAGNFLTPACLCINKSWQSWRSLRNPVLLWKCLCMFIGIRLTYKLCYFYHKLRGTIHVVDKN